MENIIPAYFTFIYLRTVYLRSANSIIYHKHAAIRLVDLYQFSTTS